MAKPNREIEMNEKFILTLIDKFNNTKIDELDLNDGSTRLVLRRGLTQGSILELSDISHPEAPAQGGKAVHLGMPAVSSPAAQGEEITSHIVATFYAAPGPDAPPFVNAGTKVKAGQTLCILEAMKMMNHLEAEFDCEIIKVHGVNGDLVEYDQVLFTVKRL